jgi:hypothetical protein
MIKSRKKAAKKAAFTEQAEIDLIRKCLSKHLPGCIEQHHDIYSVPCNGVPLEELVSLALKKGGLVHTWNSGSHTKSVDIVMESGLGVSVKAGIIRDELLTISGSRLGSHQDSISEMIGAVKDSLAKCQISVARSQKDWHKNTGVADKIYHLSVFSSSVMDYSDSRNWTASINKNGKRVWELSGPSKAIVSAKINESQSHELWTTLDTGAIGGTVRIVIPRKSVV